PSRIAQRQREEDVPRPDHALAEVAMRAIAFDPGLRFRSPGEMAARLRALAPAIAPGSAVAQLVVDVAGDRIRARRAKLDAIGSGEHRAVRDVPPAPRAPAATRIAAFLDVERSSTSPFVPPHAPPPRQPVEEDRPTRRSVEESKVERRPSARRLEE